MSMRPSCSLALLLAREAPVGAIFRRGPSKWVRLIKWDTSKDIFEPGQWLHGRVYPDRGDVSPDGELLLFFGGDFAFHREAKGTWTAISRIPYFTALSLYPQGDTWGGGGYFLDNFTARINGEVIQLPRKRGKGRGRPSEVRTWPPYPMPHELNGWTHVALDEPGAWRATKRQPRGHLTIEVVGAKAPTARAIDETGKILMDVLESPIRDWDHSGRLIHSQGGRLFATAFLRGSAKTRQIADFSDMRFESIPPPDSAREW